MQCKAIFLKTSLTDCHNCRFWTTFRRNKVQNRVFCVNSDSLAAFLSPLVVWVLLSSNQNIPSQSHSRNSLLKPTQTFWFLRKAVTISVTLYPVVTTFLLLDVRLLSQKVCVLNVGGTTGFLCGSAVYVIPPIHHRNNVVSRARLGDERVGKAENSSKTKIKKVNSNER